jgi:hypothetical protein
LAKPERKSFTRATRPHDLVAKVSQDLGAKPARKGEAWHGTLDATRIIIEGGASDVTSQEVIDTAHKVKASRARPMVYLAWGFAPDLWNRLEAASLSASVVPVLLPREWLGPQEPSRAAFRLLPRIRVKWNKGAIDLLGWEAGQLHCGKPDTTVGLDNVDGWAIQAGWEPASPFTPQAITYRERRGQMKTQLPSDGAGDSVVLIKAWDGFGQEGTTLLAPPSRKRQPR